MLSTLGVVYFPACSPLPALLTPGFLHIEASSIPPHYELSTVAVRTCIRQKWAVKPFSDMLLMIRIRTYRYLRYCRVAYTEHGNCLADEVLEFSKYCHLKTESSQCSPFGKLKIMSSYIFLGNFLWLVIKQKCRFRYISDLGILFRFFCAFLKKY